MTSIRPCEPGDFTAILEIINDAAQAYRGVIPADRWHDANQRAEKVPHGLFQRRLAWGGPASKNYKRPTSPVSNISWRWGPPSQIPHLLQRLGFGAHRNVRQQVASSAACYMREEELRHEIEAGVRFWGYVEDGALLGVMGIQEVEDVTLIRHAYVRTEERNRGIGGKLLTHLLAATSRPVLIGTWAAAVWAVGFYQKHGFTVVTPEEKDRLLRRYWSIPERQVEASVVLADSKWRSAVAPGNGR